MRWILKAQIASVINQKAVKFKKKNKHVKLTPSATVRPPKDLTTRWIKCFIFVLLLFDIISRLFTMNLKKLILIQQHCMFMQFQ